MKSVLLLLLALSNLSGSNARRWRFAAPFPGKMENSMPEPNHKAFDDLAEREKIFDTQEMSKVNKPKLVERVAINDNKDGVEGDDEQKSTTNKSKTEQPQKPLHMWGL